MQRPICSFALVTILGAVSLLVCLERAAAHDSDRPDPDPQRFAAEIQAFEEYDRKNSSPSDAILFVGSSSIRFWPTAQSFPNLVVINRGFGGSHVSDVNFYVDRLVLKYRPRLIVFYAGDNDIADRKPPQQVFDDSREFVQLVHAGLPATRIIYLSIKPSTAPGNCGRKCKRPMRLCKNWLKATINWNSST